MAETPATHTGTEAPGGHKAAGFPPFKVETFPSQIFWLAVTFAFLFVVLWRITGPRIAGTIATRRGRISEDLAAAQRNRTDAEAADGAYRTALAGARARAQTLADANRKATNDSLERDRAAAAARAHDDVARAEDRIAAARDAAKTHVVQAAEEAAIQIVAHLTGDRVSPDDAAAAVRAAVKG